MPLLVIFAIAVGALLAFLPRRGTAPGASDEEDSEVNALPKGPPTRRVPISVRQHNPGNLRSWPGVPSKGGYADFPTDLAGMRAAFINLHTYFTVHGINTVRGIVTRWAPPEDANPTEKYIAFVAKFAGVSPDQKLLYSAHSRALLKGMTEFEAGYAAWPDALFDDALKASGRG